VCARHAEFRPTATRTPGLSTCEHLPLLAQCSPWRSCPAPAVPAGRLEAFVLAQLRGATTGAAGEVFTVSEAAFVPLEQARALQRLVNQNSLTFEPIAIKEIQVLKTTKEGKTMFAEE
jgi:hypothetical protein